LHLIRRVELSGFAPAAAGWLDWALMEPEEADDAELLRAHRAGDRHAFSRLYDRHDRPCFQFIRRMLGPAGASLAEDLHQETWLAIARNAASYDPRKASFRAWLYTIARNKVWDQFRRQKVTVLAPAEDDVAMLIPDDGPSPLDNVASRELAERLVAAVEALPLEQRGAFIMFADGGLSLEEIALATGVAAETAKSRLRYARAKLREALAGERTEHV
jgi:RNA polymerase sigma-70 factor (ECF subfamily)